MDKVTLILGLFFGILIFIALEKRHVFVIGSWFRWHFKIAVFSLVAGYILAALIVSFLIGVAMALLHIIAVIVVIVTIVAALFGCIILIYAFVHRHEIGLNKEPRAGVGGFLDACTKKLWSNEWIGYLVSACAVLCIVAVIRIWSTQSGKLQELQTVHTNETQAPVVMSEVNDPSYNDPYYEQPISAEDESEYLQKSLIDLAPLAGEWPLRMEDDTGLIEESSENGGIQGQQTCTIAKEQGTYTITLIKENTLNNEFEKLGPITLQPVSEQEAQATYDEDGLGHKGMIRLVSHDNISPFIEITAENNGCGEYDDFSFAMEARFIRPEDIEQERYALQEHAVLGYIESLTYSINANDFSYVSNSLQKDSAIYSMQQQLVQNLSEKGITESIEASLIVNHEKIDDQTYRLKSSETIHILYADGSGKTIEQSYWYTVEKQDDNQWLLTDMVAA